MGNLFDAVTDTNMVGTFGYSNPFSNNYGGSEGSNTGSTSTTIPTFNPMLQPYMQGSLSNMQNFLSQGLGGLEGVLQQQNQLSGMTMQGLQDIFGSLDVANNPYLKGAAEAATNPIMQRLTDVILPGIEDTSILAGGLGGSRQGVAQGAAIGDASRNAMDATSKIYSDALQSSYNNITQLSLGLPGIQAGLSAPLGTEALPFDMENQFLQTLLGFPAGTDEISSQRDPLNVLGDSFRDLFNF